MDNIKYLGTREVRRRKNRGNSECGACGETRPMLLRLTPEGVRCYEHGKGGRAIEVHHLAGLHRGAKLTMPANAHRLVSQKLERMLDPRFLARGRSPEEEMVALAVGAAFASDYLLDQPGSPFQALHMPRGTPTIHVPGSASRSSGSVTPAV